MKACLPMCVLQLAVVPQVCACDVRSRRNLCTRTSSAFQTDYPSGRLYLLLVRKIDMVLCKTPCWKKCWQVSLLTRERRVPGTLLLFQDFFCAVVYHVYTYAACKVSFELFNRSYSQLTFFNFLQNILRSTYITGHQILILIVVRRLLRGPQDATQGVLRPPAAIFFAMYLVCTDICAKTRQQDSFKRLPNLEKACTMPWDVLKKRADHTHSHSRSQELLLACTAATSIVLFSLRRIPKRVLANKQFQRIPKSAF